MSSSRIEVRELRSGDRFRLNEPLAGTFGAIDMIVIDVAEQGAQIAHTQPIRIAARGRLWFKRGDAAASAHGLVVWSHLANSDDAYRYRSGIRIEDDVDAFAAAIQELADQRVLRRDLESLERKRRQLSEREQQRSEQPRLKLLRSEAVVPGDQALLIEHARERLRVNPDEATKWYNRARFAIAEDGAPVASDQIRSREDVLAVWEYLERTVPISTIVRVFERRV